MNDMNREVNAYMIKYKKKRKTRGQELPTVKPG